MKLTKKVGREWLALSLAGLDVLAFDNDNFVNFEVVEDSFKLAQGQILERCDCYFHFWLLHDNLLSGNLLPSFKSTNYPVSQDRNEVKPVVKYVTKWNTKREAGCLDKGLRLGDRKARDLFLLLLEALGWQMRVIECYLGSKVSRGVGLKLRWRSASFSSHRSERVVSEGES